MRRGLRASRRPSPSDNTGSTLVELLLVMMLTTMVLSVAVSMARMIMNVSQRTDGVAEASTSLRLALDSVGKVIPEAAQVSTPTLVNGNWYMEALFLPTPTTPQPICRQWRLSTTTNLLEVRTWKTSDGIATDWNTLARKITNQTTNPPFTVYRPDESYSSYRVVASMTATMPEVGDISETNIYTIRNTHIDRDTFCAEVGRT